MRVFVTEVLFEPKTYDIDFAGIVSNQVYLRWLEDLRFELIGRHFGWEKFPPNVVPVLLRTEINYRKAVKLYERISGKMWISGIEGIRWFLEARFVKGNGELVADARQGGVFFNMKKARPVRIPSELRKAMEKYREG